jgi:hypothetical protein
MSQNPIHFIMALVAGIGSVGVAFESFKFALTPTNPDPAKAKEDGPKSLGGRAAGLFVGCFCTLVAFYAAQMVFLGRVAWLF